MKYLREILKRIEKREEFFRQEMIEALDKRQWERYEYLLSLRDS